MLIAQMSDLHFLQRGMLAYGKVDTAAHAARCIAHLNAIEPSLDAVLITGDLTSDGDLATYRELAQMLAMLDAPYFPLTGNHDDRALMREVFGGLGCLPTEGPLAYAIEDFPIRILALDTLVDGKPWGWLDQAQLDWLDATLAAAPDRPTMVALHHPPFKTGIGHMDWSMLRNADGLAAVVERHPQIERVVAGHAHRSVQTRWAGTIAQIAPGIAHHVQLVLGAGRGSWICEPPGVLLHHWSEETGLVSHVSPIGDYGPTGQFSDPHTSAPNPQSLDLE